MPFFCGGCNCPSPNKRSLSSAFRLKITLNKEPTLLLLAAMTVFALKGADTAKLDALSSEHLVFKD